MSEDSPGEAYQEQFVRGVYRLGVGVLVAGGFVTLLHTHGVDPNSPPGGWVFASVGTLLILIAAASDIAKAAAGYYDDWCSTGLEDLEQFDET